MLHVLYTLANFIDRPYLVSLTRSFQMRMGQSKSKGGKCLETLEGISWHSTNIPAEPITLHSGHVVTFAAQDHGWA